jgi:hypothetical protein
MSTSPARTRRRHPVLNLIAAVLLGALAATALSELWGMGVPYAAFANIVLVCVPVQLLTIRRRSRRDRLPTRG